MKRKLKLGASVAFAGALIVAGAPSVQAYELLGPQWDENPVTYEITSGVWTNGVLAWNAANANNFFSNSPGSASLPLGSVNDSSVDWDGIYNYTFSGDVFTSGESYLNLFYTNGYSTAQAQSVAVHELGHAFGLDHVTSCVVMHPQTATRFGDCGVSTPQSDDIAGVNFL